MTRSGFGKLVMFGLAVLFSMGAAKVASAQIILNIPVIILYPPPHFAPFITGITAGFEHTCARKSDGSVYCWGVNSSGQIGVTSTANCIQAPNYNSPIPCVDKPQLVIATGMSQVAAGDMHTCALTTSGGVQCWGDGSYGEVGDYYNHPAPYTVTTNAVFSSIAAGGSTSCGISNSEALCWGEAPTGVFLGVPKVPNAVNTIWPIAQSVAVGKQFACVLLGSSPLIDVCLGNNASDQLGADATVNGTSVNHIVPSSMNLQTNGNVRIAAGRDFHCVEHTDGTVQCVGDNVAGELGLGFTSFREFSTLPVGGTQPMQLHGVAAGWAHACALDAAGHAYCWGNGDSGQLGNGISGSGYYSSKPQQVVGANGVTPIFNALAAGAEHTCGIATDNYVYCWGDNTFGEIGAGLGNIGTTGSFGVPATSISKAIRTAAF